MRELLPGLATNGADADETDQRGGSGSLRRRLALAGAGIAGIALLRRFRNRGGDAEDQNEGPTAEQTTDGAQTEASADGSGSGIKKVAGIAAVAALVAALLRFR